MAKVLITRPEPDASALAEILRGKSYSPLLEPLLTIAPVEVGALCLQDVQAVLLTSTNGLRAFASLTTERYIWLFTVGEKTAEEAKKLGFCNVMSAGGSSASLIELTEKFLDPCAGRVLHISGDVVRQDMVGPLKQKRFQIERVIVYQTRQRIGFNPETIEGFKNNAIGSVLLYSPRTARIFIDLLKYHRLISFCDKVQVFCLSAEVAREVRSCQWKKTFVASAPVQADLLKLLNENHRQCA